MRGEREIDNDASSFVVVYIDSNFVWTKHNSTKFKSVPDYILPYICCIAIFTSSSMLLYGS